MNGLINQSAFWVLTALTVVGFITAAFWYFHARKPPEELSDEEKLEKMLAGTGYAYDERQNIFYSRMDAWQRKYGYCQLYDEATVPLSMVIDCEPVRFEYRSEKWLIEFWKGRVLFSRNETHWWLTGFVLGEFSEPSELAMDASVTFPDGGMSIAFVNKLVQMGYTGREIRVLGNTVFLTFQTPRSRQPYSRAERLAELIQKKNRFLCEQYAGLTMGSRSMYERLEKLKRNSPELFCLIMGMGKPAKLFQLYENLSKYLKAGRGGRN